MTTIYRTERAKNLDSHTFPTREFVANASAVCIPLQSQEEATPHLEARMQHTHQRLLVLALRGGVRNIHYLYMTKLKCKIAIIRSNPEDGSRKYLLY